MKAIVEIDLNSLQAEQLLRYIETLPFATVQLNEKSKWQQAIDEGAVTVDEFVQEAKRQIKEHFRNA